MKIRISKHDLSKSLSTVGNTLGKGNGDDLSAHFVFRVGSNLEILTNTGTIWSGVQVNAAEFEEPEVTTRFTVEGGRLMQWVRAVKQTDIIEIVYNDDTKTVSASDSRGTQHFRSLDPEDFPYWDVQLSKAVSKATVRADLLKDALSYVKTYVLDDLQKTPQFCISEVREGSFLSCDGGAASAAFVEGLEECNIRVTGPHISAITKFLDNFGDSTVEIREGSRSYFIVAGNAILGESRLSTEFPKSIKVDWAEEAQYQWGMPADEVKDAILWLTAGASKDETRIFFEFEGEDQVCLSMKAMTGKKVSLRVKMIGFERVEGSEDLPTGGAGIPYAYLKNFVDRKGEETVWFTLTPHVDERAGKKFVSRGMLMTREETDSAKFMTTVVWST